MSCTCPHNLVNFGLLVTNYFSDPGRAVDPLCVCVFVSLSLVN